MSLEPSKVYSDGGTCVYFVLSVLNGIVYSICYSRKTKKYSVRVQSYYVLYRGL